MNVTDTIQTRRINAEPTCSSRERKGNAPFFGPLIQPKLTVNQPNDIYEQEADSMADKVMRMTTPAHNENSFFKPVSDNIQRKCQHCEDEEKLHRKENSDAATQGSHALDNYVGSLGASGQPLSESSRQFFEPRFGQDFSGVRIHTDSVAAKSAQSINALAYTTGNNIVFNSGQFSPESDSGKRLMAHELTHVVQQGKGIQPKLIQRAPGKGDAQAIIDRDKLIKDIKAEAAYKALDAAKRKLAEEIITEIKKKPIAEQNSYYLTQFQLLFKTVTQTPAQITTITNAKTDTAVADEAVRVAKPEEAKNKDMEENTAKDPARAGAFERVVGKWGGGAYYIDRRSPTDIVIKAEVMLTPTGTGTMDEVNKIKQMKDGIEKAASTKGYIVSLTFVDVAGPDTFKAGVNPEKWEDATNWSGGAPKGFAHELHHMMAYEVDRYNYIDYQARNDNMVLEDRLYWFRKELSKPAGYNDPTSIMDNAPHPNNLDVCTVAGTDMKMCMDARKKMDDEAVPASEKKQFVTPDSIKIGNGDKARIGLDMHIDFLPDHTRLHVFTAKEQGGEYKAGASRQIIGDPGKGGDYGVALSAVSAGPFIRLEARSETTGISVPSVKGTYTLELN
ncbi:protein of unknown function [Mucilaginibacter sp. OK268]|uniref:eCIS core domain-containing protein n=1 Tax=Mucilaginibacter sp. OK268 TaxID=1881048 RepID=UPI00087E1E9A|nr:DUF4157 domain-containing protein [Mucilaginibacter sp. OK268]SDP92455.1 protein of unknown function [Mucilaginibacter sp. OK268]